VFEGLRDVSMIKRPAKRPRKPRDNKRENKSVAAVRQGFSNRWTSHKTVLLWGRFFWFLGRILSGRAAVWYMSFLAVCDSDCLRDFQVH
jgi:hypothetical protein